MIPRPPRYFSFKSGLKTSTSIFPELRSTNKILPAQPPMIPFLHLFLSPLFHKSIYILYLFFSRSGGVYLLFLLGNQETRNLTWPKRPLIINYPFSWFSCIPGFLIINTFLTISPYLFIKILSPPAFSYYRRGPLRVDTEGPWSHKALCIEDYLDKDHILISS